MTLNDNKTAYLCRVVRVLEPIPSVIAGRIAQLKFFVSPGTDVYFCSSVLSCIQGISILSYFLLSKLICVCYVPAFRCHSFASTCHFRKASAA